MTRRNALSSLNVDSIQAIGAKLPLANLNRLLEALRPGVGERYQRHGNFYRAANQAMTQLREPAAARIVLNHWRAPMRKIRLGVDAFLRLSRRGAARTRYSLAKTFGIGQGVELVCSERFPSTDKMSFGLRRSGNQHPFFFAAVRSQAQGPGRPRSAVLVVRFSADLNLELPRHAFLRRCVKGLLAALRHTGLATSVRAANSAKAGLLARLVA